MKINNSNYTLLKSDSLSHLNIKAAQLEHKKTGAQLLILKNDDSNKLFSINFRTIPNDSTGVAHILEHSVLAGSKNFPLKDPFIQLSRTSLTTYLNAWTYPDKTIYPVASENDQDLYNLVSVYLDAVFFPLVAKETLQQEGWHYEFDEKGKLIYKGVVFNEMKGAMANIDNIIWRALNSALFPTNTYANNSGGQPENIPDLTYEDFIKFHKKYYHPTNAKIVLYGDVDIERELSQIDECLSKFDRDESVLESIEPVKPFAEPRKAREPYPVQEGTDTDHHAVIAWGLSNPSLLERIVIEIVTYLLLQTDSSELRRRLQSETSVKEISSEGFEEDLLQPAFQIVAKGIKEEDIPKFEQIVLDELEKLTKSIDQELLEATVNRIEFRKREGYERGDTRAISYLHMVSMLWNYDMDPLARLYFIDELDQIRKSPDLIKDTIKKLIIDNPHRVLVDLYPDTDLQSEREKKEAEKLMKIQAGMKPAQLDKIKQEAEKLKKIQDAEEPPELIDTLPMLRVADLPKEVKRVEMEVVTEDDTHTLLFHPQQINGIIATDIFMDVSHLDAEELQYASLLFQLLTRVSTEKYQYQELSKRLDTVLGGIGTEVFTTRHHKTGERMVRAALSYKYLPATSDLVPELISQILLHSKLDDAKRIREIIRENAQALEDSIVEAGHNYAFLSMASRLSEEYLTMDLLEGIQYIKFLKWLEASDDNQFMQSLEKLNRVYTKVVNQTGMLYNLTTTKELRDSGLANLEAVRKEFLSESGDNVSRVKFKLPDSNAALTLPVGVNYVSSGFALPSTYSFKGYQFAINKIVRSQYLWEEIRVKGGAYGSIIVAPVSIPIVGFSSYRDPNIQSTIDTYHNLSKFLTDKEFADKDVEGAIISGLAALDEYTEPIMRGYNSAVRYMTGLDDDRRQTLKDELLATTVDDFREFGTVVEEGFSKDAPICIIGNEEKINEVKEIYKLEVSTV